jgi:hypothetical protein
MHKQHFRMAAVLSLLLAFAMAMPSAIQAQSAGTGAINGTVSDQSGAVIPGAQVTIKNAGTGEARSVSTTEAGRYSAPFLTPGTYEVTAKQGGFTDVVVKGILVEVGQNVVIDVSMPVKAAEESVTVTSEAALVETEKFDVSQNINTDQVENLPLNGRRWDNLALLTPGASEDGGFGGISFRGINSLYNNNMVDGADNNQAFFSEARGRTRIGYGYSLNSIKEFQVQTAAYSAEYGRAAGGVVNAVTKSGTSEYHGDFFYFIRDKAFIARDPVANGTGAQKPDERRQQFGGSFSGPLIQDKLFFFLNYDQQRRSFPAVIIPFGSDLFNGTVGSAPNNTNASQTERCTDPNCAAILTELDRLINTVDARRGDQWLGLSKIDYQLNPNHRISGVFNILRWDSPNGILTGPTLTSTSLSNGSDTVHNEFITVTWNGVLSPSLVNESRFQYGRDFEAQTPNASGPNIQVSDVSNIGMPNFLPRGAFPNEKRFQWVDNVSWLKGSHQVKFGFDINYVRENIQNLFQGGGIYRYFDTNSSTPGVSEGALNKFVEDLFNGTRQYADFVQSVDPITGDGAGFFTTTDWNFYFQDTWKVAPAFTLNFGIRYELQTMPNIVQANPLVPQTGPLNTDSNNFGPRLGFSWGMGAEQKGVLRGGYGLYYGRTQNSSIFTHLFQNGVFQQAFRFTPSSCGAPVVPNTVFPQPSTVGSTTPIFGTSGPAGTNNFASLADYLTACPTASAQGAVINALADNFVNPLVHQYDIAYERELWWKLGLTVSYLGSRGNRLPVFADANLPQPNSTRDYFVLDSTGTPTGQTFTLPFWDNTTMRPNPNTGVILMGRSEINSWYSGMVVRLRRRESRGFSFDMNYTWSKAWDNGQVAGVNGTFAGTNSPLNPFDLRAEYGLSDLDIRNRFIMNIYWNLPFGDMTDNPTAKTIIGGWKASTVIRAQDGRPVQTNMSNQRPCSFASGFQANGSLTCAAVSSFGSSTNGRAPAITRNTVYTTPGLLSFDLRLAKEFRIRERGRIEFLWEAFNLFNRTQELSVDNRAFSFVGATAPTMTNPNPTCSTTLFSGTTPAGGCIRPTTNFLNVQSTGNTLYGARQMQFGVKFSF